MKYLIILIAITTMACSKDKSPSEPKNLFSLWSSGTAGSLDLSGADFGSYPISFAYTANAGCDCTIEITGTQSEGSARIHSCTQYGPVNYCDPGTSIYGYVKSNTSLTVCTAAGDCDYYQ